MKVKHIILYPFKKLNQFKSWYMHTSWKKRITVTIVILILLFILKNIFFGGQKQQYSFDTVQKGTISQLVTENGRVISSNETDVFSPTNGVLDQIYVHNGDTVTTGDKLFTVRSTATAQEQAVAYANYLQAQTILNAANATEFTLQSSLFAAWKAYTDLATNSTYQNSDGSPNTANRTLPAFTTVQNNWLAAEAQDKNQQGVIAQTQAGLNSASLAYQATQNATVTAPTSGIVGNIVGLTGAKVLAETNSAVAGTSQTQTTVTPVMVVGNTNASALQTTVSEVDINKVSVGQQVDIAFSAIQGTTYKGHITQIDSYGTNNQGVITYNVFVVIDNTDNMIKSAMSANMTIYTAKHDNVLTVANAAIVPYQNGKAVQMVNKNDKVIYKLVKVGLRGFTRSEIVSGVGAGTKVILGNTTLTNNGGSLGN